MKGILYICEVGAMVLDGNLEVVSTWKYPDSAQVESYEQLKRGELPSGLLEVLSSLKDIEALIVAEAELVEALSKEGFKVEEASDDLMDELMFKKLGLMVKAGLATSEDDARDEVRDFAITLSEIKLREVSAKPDLHIIEAIQALDEVEKTLNILATRVREWYGLHFPELSSFVDDPKTYVRLVSEFGERENIRREELVKLGFSIERAESISVSAKSSKGGEVHEEDLIKISAIAEEVIRLDSLKDKLSSYVEKNMNKIAPNITSVVGASIGARLIAKVGGLNKLAMLPASTIQVLGAEKALFRALRTGTRPPKHGIIFQHKAIHSAPKWQRGKIARSMAAKIAIAARVDAFRGSVDKKIEERLQTRLEEIKEKYSEPPKRVKKLKEVVEKHIEPSKKKKRGRIKRRGKKGGRR
ncbi:MAG: C/D box methylation guide ribonucleoprotein complex aNOP56 subunit [archaeon]|nr:C/D box methylation guide ribonucleoprotein complex aNOP56 subunit [archaeon]